MTQSMAGFGLLPFRLDTDSLCIMSANVSLEDRVVFPWLGFFRVRDRGDYCKSCLESYEHTQDFVTPTQGSWTFRERLFLAGKPHSVTRGY